MLPLAEITTILHRTPDALEALLGALPDPLTTSDYGKGTFSPYNVVGHLIIGEQEDWIPRARIILEHGAARPFDPFPHNATVQPDSGRSMRSLLEEFGALRRANLDALDSMRLSPRDLSRGGLHPALGQVTLGELLATWVVHDLHHTAQITKGLGYQFRQQVGPWRAYVGILRQAERASPDRASPE